MLSYNPFGVDINLVNILIKFYPFALLISMQQIFPSVFCMIFQLFLKKFIVFNNFLCSLDLSVFLLIDELEAAHLGIIIHQIIMDKFWWIKDA
jgi:hypothetical protein